MASVIETVYNHFRNGDALTDHELEVGINHFKPLADMLYLSGPVFRLAAVEANRVAMRLEEFKQARKSK